MDAMQKITGSINTYPISSLSPSGTGAFTTGSASVAGNIYSAGGGIAYKYTTLFDASNVARTGTETRPINFTVRIWKRIA